MDLTKILKHAPKGFKLYSTIYGDIEFDHIDKSSSYPIILRCCNNLYQNVTKHGKHIIEYEDKAECILFPSKDQRDWNKFTAPWYKEVKDGFDPKTLRPFVKVLVRDDHREEWRCEIFSHITDNDRCCPYVTTSTRYKYCIPYNEDTKHLVGTTKEAPEFYKYWED